MPPPPPSPSKLNAAHYMCAPLGIFKIETLLSLQVFIPKVVKSLEEETGICTASRQKAGGRDGKAGGKGWE